MSKLYELKLIKALVLMHFFRNLPTVFMQSPLSCVDRNAPRCLKEAIFVFQHG